MWLEDTLTSLANRVIRLNAQLTTSEQKTFTENVGVSAGIVAERLLNAFAVDVIHDKAVQTTGKEKPDESELEEVKKELIKEATELFHNPDIREYIENVRRSHDQIIDDVNLDHVVFAGFDTKKAGNADKVIQSFHEFIEENKDEIIALRIIYDQAYKDRPMILEGVKSLYGKLTAKGITVERLWDSYAVKKPERLKQV